jgi:hypothetical protein
MHASAITIMGLAMRITSVCLDAHSAIFFARDPTAIMIVDFRIQWVIFCAAREQSISKDESEAVWELLRRSRLIDLCDHFRQ